MAKWIEMKAFRLVGLENLLQCTNKQKKLMIHACMVRLSDMIEKCISLKIFEPSNKDVWEV